MFKDFVMESYNYKNELCPPKTDNPLCEIAVLAKALEHI